MRPDQRLPDQLRPVRFETDYLLTAEGSVLIEVGNTRVLCAASVEETVPQWLRGSGKGWVTAEYSMLPRSTVTRTAREISRGRPSGRTQEIQRLIGRASARGDRSARAGRTQHHPRLRRASGRRRHAHGLDHRRLRGPGLALQRLVDYGAIKRLPIREAVAAASVGIVAGEPLLDLCYDEDSRAEVDMNVVMTSSGRFVEVQATAEQTPFEEAQMGRLLELARGGIRQLLEIQQDVLRHK